MNKELEDIKAIREMMEKSSRFLSLSGMSGIIAGIAGLCGAGVAMAVCEYRPDGWQTWLVLDGLVTLLVALSAALFFSVRKAKRAKQKFFNQIFYKTLYNLCIPLFVGGFLSALLFFQHLLPYLAPVTLLFYGLGLINASKYTYDEIHYLGLCELILGLGASVLPDFGLIFWALGFGVCHVVYGVILYTKYDLK